MLDAIDYEDNHYLALIPAQDDDSIEDDGTVDGIHLTDLGFKYYAQKLVPVLRPLIK